MAVFKKKTSGFKKKFLRKKVCQLCTEKRDIYDYKEVDKLRHFISEKGKIVPRKISGMCAKHQRELSKVIKRSRHAGLMSFTSAI